jgi:hypothetical protein
MKRTLTALFLGLSLLFASGGVGYASDSGAVSLFRNSLVIENTKIHIATFDANEKAWQGSRFDYNMENCQTAAKLFQAQIGVKTKFWCEKSNKK